ncbi:MAG: CBS domain-containing protein [Chloroflexaceae bacterium]|nr:CBS domain-containing protein [Chloroflexaceae bacterium]
MSERTYQRVRIYLSENDYWDNQPLHVAVLKVLQREGATGATVFAGHTGFGPRMAMRSADFMLSDHHPMVVEWVDRADTVQRILPLLNDLLGQTLITFEEVQLYRASLRTQGPFSGELNIGNVMQTNLQTVTPTTALGAALAQMLSHQQRTMPVIEENRLVGVLTDYECERRLGLPISMRLLRVLTAEEQQAILEQHGQQTVQDAMNSYPRTVYMGGALPQALITMIEWNYDQVPVVARDGSYAGLIGSEDILRAAVTRPSGEDGEVRTIDLTTNVQMVLQSIAPTVHIDRPLPDVVRQLLQTPLRYLIAIDDERRVRGTISDTDLLQRLNGNERAALLTTLQQTPPALTDGLLQSSYTLAQIVERDITVFKPQYNILEAGRRLLELKQERAPVVDDNGSLMGIVTRSGLLRALIQESQ